jgi:hypothetical protein
MEPATLTFLEQHVPMTANTRMLELGNQLVHFSSEWQNRPAKEWYALNYGLTHVSIDRNGEDGALPLDFCLPLPTEHQATYDVVTDYGMTEHTDNLYASWLNIHTALKDGGHVIHVLPKTGNWAGHGHWYFTTAFFEAFAALGCYQLLGMEEHPAMHNRTNGWTIMAVLKKTGLPFPDRSTFMALPVELA